MSGESVLQKYLKRIKWNKPYKVIVSDIQNYFTHFYEMNIEKYSILDAWDYVSRTNGLASYMAMKRLRAERFINESDETEIVSIIRSNADKGLDGCNDLEKIAKAVVLSVIVGYKSKSLNHRINETSSAERNVIFSSAFRYIDEMSSSDLYVLKLSVLIYDRQYLKTDELSRILFEGGYDKPYDEVKPLLNEFLLRLCQDKEFRLATNVKNAYNYDFRQTGITAEKLFDALSGCDNDNFFRGCLIYRDLLDALSNQDKLKTWYSTIESIRSDTATYNLSTITHLCASYAVEIDPRNASKTISYIGLDKKNLEGDVIIRAGLREHYRKACYDLILNEQGEFLLEFLKLTEKANFDKYTFVSSRPSNLRNEIGVYNTEELSKKVVRISDDINDVLFVFFNTFIRGAISLRYFLVELEKRFSVNNKVLAEMFDKYRFQCVFDTDRPIPYKKYTHRGEPGFYDNIRPFAISKRDRDIMLISKEGREKLYSMGYEDFFEGRVFTAKLVSYDFSGRLPIYIFEPSIGESLQVSDIRDLIYAYQLKQISGQIFFSSIRYININMLKKNEEYTDLCIDILKLVIKAASEDMKECRNTIKNIQNINFYAYYPTSVSTYNRVYRLILPEQYGEIWRCWENLKALNLSEEDGFLIYSNTILRKCYNLEDFLNAMICKKDRKDCLKRLGVQFTGRIKGLAIDRNNPDNFLLMTDPAAFKIIIGAPKTGENKYTRFIYEIPLNGESGTSFRKRIGIKKKTRVSFEIASYNGEGNFAIDNVRILRKENLDYSNVF